MSVRIRNYKDDEFKMIDSWWKSANELGPIPGMLPEETTFVLEFEGEPALCITLYTTNSKEVAYLENFIGSPKLKGVRKALAPQIIDHASRFAKSRGIRRLVCLAPNEKLEGRYTELGFTKTVKGLTALTKELF
jgi:hypothetical protein